jgi:hypothetical protein
MAKAQLGAQVMASAAADVMHRRLGGFPVAASAIRTPGSPQFGPVKTILLAALESKALGCRFIDVVWIGL